MSGLTRIQSNMVTDPTTGSKVSDQIGILSKNRISILSYQNLALNVGNSNEDWSPAIQAAMDFVGQNGGGTVIIPYGTYLSQPLFFNYDNITIEGSGFGSWLKFANGSTYCLFSNWDQRATNQGVRGRIGLQVRNLRIWGNRGGINVPGQTFGHIFNLNKVKHLLIENVWMENIYGDGIRVMHDFTSTNQADYAENVLIKKVIIDSFGRSGIGIESQVGLSIEDCTVTNQMTLTDWTNEGLPSAQKQHGFGIEVEADQNYRTLEFLSIQRNRVVNCNYDGGIKIHAAPNTSVNSTIQHNAHIKDNWVINSTKSLFVRLFNNVEIAGNHVINDSTSEGAISIHHGVSLINVHDNFVNGVPNGVGIQVEDIKQATDTTRLPVTNVRVHHNMVTDAGYQGIRIGVNLANNVDHISVEDNEVVNPCGNTSDTLKYGVYVSGGVNNIKLKGNTVLDNRQTPVMKFGIVTSTTPVYGVCTNNVLSGHTIGGIADQGGQLIIRDNKGYVSQNSGTITLNAAATSVSVAHGLSGTPALQNINVTPNSSWGASTKFWVSGSNSSSITVTVDTAPGGSGIPFAWEAHL